jgi:hypothetical protein
LEFGWLSSIVVATDIITRVSGLLNIQCRWSKQSRGHRRHLRGIDIHPIDNKARYLSMKIKKAAGYFWDSQSFVSFSHGVGLVSSSAAEEDIVCILSSLVRYVDEYMQGAMAYPNQESLR